MSKTGKALKTAALTGALSGALPAAFTFDNMIRLRLRESATEHLQEAGAVRYPEGVRGGERARSMDEVMASLREIPFNPKPYGGVLSTIIFALPDIYPMLMATRPSTSGLLYRYPKPFQKVVPVSEDGTPIQGVMALHPDNQPRPALVMVHGLFGSKNIRFSQQVILSAYYGWGYNVMAIDLRFFGESKKLSGAPGSGGWKEGQDILAAARHLKSLPQVTSVAVMGGSYGAASAILASAQCGDDCLDGGVIAFCPYGDTARQLRFISTAPRPWEPFSSIYPFFMACFKMTTAGHYKGYGTFERFLREYSAPYYGVAPDELIELSSPALHLEKIKVPTLVVNTRDDPVIPLEQGRILAEAASDNPAVRSMILEAGGHCGVATVDRAWMSRAVRTFYDYWAWA
ncbi:MAG: alpha/beta fold hydrolase [Actinomycetota bacterium]|nr:alpha/beta fold hydrolase [Actinomycetota bacterium]